MTNPTSNYGWVLPNSADLVTDLPADFDVALQGVDTRLKALQPGTTLGDLAYSSATANTNTRLPIGTSGQVLAVSGGVPSWTTPAGGGSGELTYTLLNSGGTALTGATSITVSGLSGYNAYFILIVGASTVDANSSIFIRPNADSTAANYSGAGTVVQPYDTYTPVMGSAVGVTTGADTIRMGQMTGLASGLIHGSFILWGGKTTGRKAWQLTAGGTSVGSGQAFNILDNRFGIYNATSVISSFAINTNIGNFDAGTVYIYGGTV